MFFAVNYKMLLIETHELSNKIVCFYRGKQSIALDIRATKGQSVFKKMCKKADVLIEPFRPG